MSRSRTQVLLAGLTTLFVVSLAKGQPDLNFSLAAVTTPTGSETVTALPGSITEVCHGDTYYVELWVSDVTGSPATPNTGVSSAYVDLLWPGGQATAASIDHGTIYDTLATGTIGAGQIDELGGSVLSSTGVGIEPEWARVAVVTLSADATGIIAYTLQQSTTGAAALGRGQIPWANIALNGVTLTVNALPATPTLLAATPALICEGESSTLSASVGAGEEVDWYTVSCGGTYVGTGSPVVSPTVTTTYYARAQNTTTSCESLACDSVTVTVNPAPATPTLLAATPATICEGDSSTLSATVGGGEEVDWYTGSCGGTYVGTGSPVVSPTVTTTYYARAQNTTTACESLACDSVTVTVDPAPATPTTLAATPATICEGESSTLSASVGAGEEVDWYTVSCGGTYLGTGSPVVSPTVTTTYYARAQNTTTGCESLACDSVTVTVNPAPATPSTLAATPALICEGASSTLSASVSAGEEVDWYTGGCGGTYVGTGSPVVSPTVTTTYYARAQNTTTSCESLACDSVTVTVNAAPATPTTLAATPALICEGYSSTLSASVGAGEEVDWFTSSCGGTYLGTGSPVVSPTVTTTYYARARNTTTGCNSLACDSVTVTVDPAPATPTLLAATPALICEGDSSTLSASVSAGEEVDWYTVGCGGTYVGTGSPVVSPTVTTTYYARSQNTTTGCESLACDSVTVTVDPAPTAPANAAAVPLTICEGDSSTLTASVAGTEIDWYTDGCGTTFVATGTLIVLSPTVTTTYYARSRNPVTGCNSLACDSVTVAVDPAPATPTLLAATPATICEGDSSMLSATVGAGEEVDWYTVSCGGTYVGTGSPVVSPTVTTTYYARAQNTTTGCESLACDSVTVTVNPAPSTAVNAMASPATICEGDTSTLSASVTGAEIDWYTDGCGVTFVGTGNSIPVTPAVTTTYYAVARDAGTGCESLACDSVTVTVTYCISGNISAFLGTPIESVLVSADAGGGSDATDAFGDYLLVVPMNWSGTVTPCKDNWLFTLPDHSYTNVTLSVLNADFTGTLVYDLDPPGTGDEFVGVGDLSQFALSWQQSVPPANALHDFDCDLTVGAGDFSYFATAWLKNVFDAGIQIPACQLCGGRAAPEGDSGVLLEVHLVATLTPSPEDLARELPTSTSWIGVGQTYFVEMWVRDMDETGPGVTSAYAHIAFGSQDTFGVRRATAQAVSPSEIFGTLASGSIGRMAVKDLGGSALAAGVGTEGLWARVATVELDATGPGRVRYSLLESPMGFAAYGSGLVPWDNIEPSGVTVDHTLPTPGIGRTDFLKLEGVD